jgi:CRISPR-associated protein Cmx8
MAKTKSTSKPELDGVTITYDLFDLPTAQHKAGLAGLILQVRSMKARRFAPEMLPEVEVSSTQATVRFTKVSVQALFDDLYSAEMGEVAVRSKWQDQKPEREEEVEEIDPETKKVKKTKRFVYKVVQPSGHFLADHYPAQDGTWLKLWRDMLWAIPRGIPLSRIPFQQRAAGQPCKEGSDAWNDLIKVTEARKANRFYTTEVASSLWLGAQAFNAEAIPFCGRAEQNLVLHFWPLTVLIFVPQMIDNDGKAEFVGYVLTIPEVANLEYFCEDFPLLLRDLKPGTRGYRPAAAVVDVPAQGALEFLEHLARLAPRLAEKQRIASSVSSIEYLHLVKIGNNVKSMAAGRVVPKPQLLEEYLAIVGADKAPYRNPLFRAGLLLSLLKDLPWHGCLAAMLAQRPWPFFIRSEKTSRTMPWFATDAAAKFEDVHKAFQEEMEVFAMTVKDKPAAAGDKPKPPLEDLVFRLVRNYVQRKTEEKSGLKWDDFKDRKIKDEKTGRERIEIPQAYSDAKEKVASGTFLAMRSRREQDFVDYFTATICSVGQFLPEDDFRIVADALLRNRENVKTLTLLALSANS